MNRPRRTIRKPNNYKEYLISKDFDSDDEQQQSHIQSKSENCQSMPIKINSNISVHVPLKTEFGQDTIKNETSLHVAEDSSLFVDSEKEFSLIVVNEKDQPDNSSFSFSCEKCSYSTNSMENYNKHLNKHSGMFNYLLY